MRIPVTRWRLKPSPCYHLKCYFNPRQNTFHQVIIWFLSLVLVITQTNRLSKEGYLEHVKDRRIFRTGQRKFNIGPKLAV